MNINPLSFGTIHIVGIGGIGMSGIAEILHARGHAVQGSDAKESANTQRLREKGIPIFIGHKASNICDASIVVLSSAITKLNPEIAEANKKGVPILSRCAMLKELLAFYPTIAISGTHGKTTTTSLISTVLSDSPLAPTTISGGIINALGTNAKVGDGSWVIVEADESDGTFAHLPTTIAVVTNIEEEHLDFYGSFNALKEAFSKYIKAIPFYGFSVLCLDNPAVYEIAQTLCSRRYVSYGKHAKATYRYHNITYTEEGTRFHICAPDDNIYELFLPLHGEHNVANATAAFAVGSALYIPPAKIITALASFSGVKRRFTHIGTRNTQRIIDDYAHHPSEIRHVIQGAVALGKPIVAVFQPHRYSRVRDLFSSFASCFTQAAHVFITPIFPAGEDPLPSVNSTLLADAIRKESNVTVSFVNDEKSLQTKLKQHQECTVLFLGAGSISKWAYNYYEELSA